jgi:L-cystine transport system permease protein
MSDIFEFELFINSFPQLLLRLHITLFIVIVAIFCGFILGAALAAARLYKLPVLSQMAVAYVSLIRGIPILVLLFIVYIGLPMLVGQFGVDINRWDTLLFVLIAYSLDVAAFLSEIIRASVSGVDKGQTEAAYSVGMTRVQTFVRIVGPQAVKIAIPSLGNTIVSLLKDTSLAYTLGVIDVVGMIRTIATRTNRSLEAYAAAAILFFILSSALERCFRLIEKNMGIKRALPGQRTAANGKSAGKMTIKGR